MENMGSLPFWFNQLWLESEGVRDIISKAWHCFILGSLAFIWEQKLKLVKNALKKWVTQHYQEPTIKKIEIFKEMETLQENMAKMEITKELLRR